MATGDKRHTIQLPLLSWFQWYNNIQLSGYGDETVSMYWL